MYKPKSYHGLAIRAIREEKRRTVDQIVRIKTRLKYLYQVQNEGDQEMFDRYVAYYGGNISDLTKERDYLREDLNDMELSTKMLKDDARKRIEYDRTMFEATERFKKEGSYNCLGGC